MFRVRSHSPLRTRRAALGGGAVALTAATALGVASASGFGHQPQVAIWDQTNAAHVFDHATQNATAVADTYSTTNVGTLVADSAHGLLANDAGGPVQLISNTQPAHGALTLKSDGSFEYVPDAGYTGTDSFTYTVSNAVHLYTTHLPSLGSFAGINVTAGGYGSSLYPDPGHPGFYYGLEDRGPNVASGSINVEPIPSYDPAIGLFYLAGNKAVLVRKIPLEDASGHPYSGLVNSQNTTGETIEDLTGNKLATDPNGYDSEGLVAMPDGTFWVSDEYGPFITHFDHWGHAIQRLSPLDGTLPAELRYRVPNRGLEGLTITPDGTTLVAAMQSALQQSDLGTTSGKSIVPTRIITYNLRTKAVHEYLYLLHDPKINGTANSELTALSNTTFLMDERDGNFPGTGIYKKLWKIDITGATDVGPAEHVSGATYNGTAGGLLIGGKTIEKTVSGQNTAAAATTLQAEGITPVAESLYVDLDALLGSLDPAYSFYSHDKIEGVATTNGGRYLMIANDSDFGIAGVTANATGGWTLVPKVSPVTGRQDDGEFLAIDMDKVNPTTSAAPTSSATVTINVTAGS